MTRTRGLLGWSLTGLLLSGSALSGSASAQLNNGSTGVDGAFAPTGNFVVDLNSMGTYDASNWAVVFNFTTVTIPSGVTVTFTTTGRGRRWFGCARVMW